MMLVDYVFSLLLLPLRLFLWLRRPSEVSVAFFHPYCNDGGGGERVLWLAIKSMREKHPDIKYYVYSGDYAAGKNAILAKVETQFGFSLEGVEFVFLRTRFLVEPSCYPVFTILGQSIASVAMGVEALWRLNPHVVIDSMGYAFTYPVFSWVGGCHVLSYTHYPTVSMDMLQSIGSSETKVHNARSIAAHSRSLSSVKLWYYTVFAALYGFCGRRAAAVMVNSSWTQGHINSIWRISDRTTVVYPPVNVAEFQSFALEERAPLIVSIGQFRPEKMYEGTDKNDIKLVLIGSSRQAEDTMRVNALKELAKELRIDDRVVFEINAPFSTLKSYLSSGLIGIHTMWCEHFGIGVLEMTASGLVTVAHASGGPKEDIIRTQSGEETGFLASTEQEYAEKMKAILLLTRAERLQMQQRARHDAHRFSDRNFARSFMAVVDSAIGKKFISKS